MNTKDAKLELIEWIAGLSDEGILLQIAKVKTEADKQSDEELMAALQLGIEDIEAGRIVPHEEVMKKFTKWL